jgi:HEAT repeat protein
LERLRGLRQLEPWTMPILVATSPIDAADPAADAARLDAILADAAAPQALRMLATRQRAEHPQTPPVLKRLQGASDLQFVGADALDDVPALTALVSDADPVVRAAAISALARLTPVEARRALLLPHLDDANAAVRRAAIATMAALLPLDEAVAVLSTRLRTTDDPDQGHIIAAIRTIPDRQAVDALIAALAEPHSRPGAWYALMTLSGEAPENADADYWRAWRDRRFGAPAP